MHLTQSHFQASLALFIVYYLSFFPHKIGRVGGRAGSGIMKGISYVFCSIGNLRKHKPTYKGTHFGGNLDVKESSNSGPVVVLIL